MISLDHDLGDESKVGTGYDVLKFIEEEVYAGRLDEFSIEIHTANSAARPRMMAAWEKIIEVWGERRYNNLWK